MNKFINDYFDLFYQHKIITFPKRNKTTSKYNILDFSGKAFKDIVVKLKYCEKTKKKLTYEDLYNLLDLMIRKIIAFNPKNEWYIVFDPIIRYDKSIVEELKLEEW